MDDITVSVSFDWIPYGTVTVDGPTIQFEPAPRAPGIYRIDLDATHAYIGEASDLARRFSGYRKPGGNVDTLVPRTNRRVQRKILEALAAGGIVPVRICTAATVTVAGETTDLTLDKSRRLLVEGAAIVIAERDGYTLENLFRR